MKNHYQQTNEEVIHASWRDIQASFASLDPDRDLTFARIEDEEPENTGMLDFSGYVTRSPWRMR